MNMNDEELRRALNRDFGAPPDAPSEELARILLAAGGAAGNMERARPWHFALAAASIALAIAVGASVRPAAAVREPIADATDAHEQSLERYQALAAAIIRRE